MKSANYPWCVVVSGHSANSLGVVRSLGRLGVPVALVDVDRRSPARVSRFVRRRIPVETGSNTEEQWLRALLGFARECGEKPVLIPTGDDDTLIISRLLPKLGDDYRIQLPDHRVLETVTEKRSFYRLMETKGITHPRSIGVTCPEDFLAAAETMGFPFLVKPSSTLDFTTRFRRKLFLVRNRPEFDSVIRKLGEEPFDGVIQEYIPARLHHEVYTYLSSSGEPLDVLAWDRLRQFPPNFGTASLCRSVLRPDAITFVLEILKKLEFKGFAAVEVIQDRRDGRWKVIDLNPRTTLQNALARVSRQSLEWLAYCHLSGRTPGKQSRFSENVLWVDDFRFAASTLMSLFGGNEKPSDLLLGLMKPKVHSTRSLSDPLPFASAFLQAVRESVPWLSGFAGRRRRNGRRKRGPI